MDDGAVCEIAGVGTDVFSEVVKVRYTNGITELRHMDNLTKLPEGLYPILSDSISNGEDQ